MLFDTILQSPEFFSGAFNFFIGYILLPLVGVFAGFSFIIFLYGYVKSVHLGDYYSKGEDEGKELMGKGLIFMGLCAGIFIISYYFLV